MQETEATISTSLRVRSEWVAECRRRSISSWTVESLSMYVSVEGTYAWAWQVSLTAATLLGPLENADLAGVGIELLAHPFQPGAFGHPLGSEVADRDRGPDPLHSRLRHAVGAEREHRFRRIAAPLVLGPDRIAEKQGAVSHRCRSPRAHGLPRLPQDEEPRTGRAAAGKRIADSRQVGVEQRWRVDGLRKPGPGQLLEPSRIARDPGVDRREIELHQLQPGRQQAVHGSTRHSVPPGPSRNSTPRAATSARIASARAKSFALRAARRAPMRSSTHFGSMPLRPAAIWRRWRTASIGARDASPSTCESVRAVCSSAATSSGRAFASMRAFKRPYRRSIRASASAVLKSSSIASRRASTCSLSGSGSGRLASFFCAR